MYRRGARRAQSEERVAFDLRGCERKPRVGCAERTRTCLSGHEEIYGRSRTPKCCLYTKVLKKAVSVSPRWWGSSTVKRGPDASVFIKCGI